MKYVRSTKIYVISRLFSMPIINLEPQIPQDPFSICKKETQHPQNQS
jgi:hypothetical protein